MYLSELPTEDMRLADVPLWHKNSVCVGNTKLIRCGAVKRENNEPDCFPNEEQCAGRICRVIFQNRETHAVHVIRDEGGIWEIDLHNFEEVTRINVVK